MAYANRKIDKRGLAVATIVAALLQGVAMSALLQGFFVDGPREPFAQRERWPMTFVTLPPLPPCHCGPPRPPEPPYEPVPELAPVKAKPSNAPARWITTADYPARDLREGNEGATAFRLAIDRSGKAKSCEVTGSSGFASLDQATCRLVLKRARFEPPSRDGRPMPGEYVNRVRWTSSY